MFAVSYRTFHCLYPLFADVIIQSGKAFRLLRNSVLIQIERLDPNHIHRQD